MIQLTSLIHSLLNGDDEMQELLKDVVFVDGLYVMPDKLRNFLQRMPELYEHRDLGTGHKINGLYDEISYWLSSNYMSSVHRAMLYDLLRNIVVLRKLYEYEVNLYPYIFWRVVTLTPSDIIEYFVDEYAKILRTNSNACFIASV